MALIKLIQILSWITTLTWTMAGFYVYAMRERGKEPLPIILATKLEIRPFVPTLAVLNLIADLILSDSFGHKFFSVFACAYLLYLYVVDKDDDDRWKRRRKKANDYVKNLGHKLAVTPAQG